MDKDFLLIWKMKNGDEEAMEKFVNQYYKVILQYCFYHSSDRDRAQDLTQVTFERFFGSLAEYRHIGKPLNYLYVIARNACIDFYKANKTNLEIAVESFPESLEYTMDSVESRLDMELALSALPEEFREAVILHYFQDLTLQEVSEILGIGLPLVKYRIRKAKERLREQLGKELNYENG